MERAVDWTARADAAESAVLHRHVRRVGGLPGTALGVVSWPAGIEHRLLFRWHLWWQAHLLDCAIDALDRSGGAGRRRLVRSIARTIRLRNGGRWTNAFYDDMAWLGLALQRAGAVVGPAGRAAVGRITAQIRDAMGRDPGHEFVGIPWQRGDVFRNTPANGPAAILLARGGALTEARIITDWIDRQLVVPATGLIADGIRDGGAIEPTAYSYGQGVVLGAELELARHGADRSRIHRLTAAVDQHLTAGGVLRGHGGGDGGLFTGILARYLALVARQLPGDDSADRRCRTVAARLVLDSAGSAWDHAARAPGGPRFGADWTVPAPGPGPGEVRPRRSVGADPDQTRNADRDLSVQLSGWMLTEAAASLG